MDRTLKMVEVATTSGGNDIVRMVSPEEGQTMGGGKDASLEGVFVEEKEIDPLTFVLTDLEQKALRIGVPRPFSDSTRTLFNTAEYKWVNRVFQVSPQFFRAT